LLLNSWTPNEKGEAADTHPKMRQGYSRSPRLAGSAATHFQIDVPQPSNSL